jgi:hypothetical protein
MTQEVEHELGISGSSVILATWESEIGRTAVSGQASPAQAKKACKTFSMEKKAGHGGTLLSSQ